MDVLNARSLLARRDKKKTTASGIPLYPRNTHATELIKAITDSLQRFAQWVDRWVSIGRQDSFGSDLDQRCRKEHGDLGDAFSRKHQAHCG